MAECAHRKVTISLPEDLIEFADGLARARSTTRSGVIGEVLAELRAQRLDRLAREGYRFYALEAEEFDLTSASAVAEAIDDDGSAW